MRRMTRNISISCLAALVYCIIGVGTAGATNGIVLGSSEFAKPNGEGWGTSRPTKIFNGGDPNGLVKEIQWTSWGHDFAIGYGLGWIFKPMGGYYNSPVLVELRAQAPGRCGQQRAYTQLAVRFPEKPEGPLRRWELWSGAKSLCKVGL